MRLYSMYFQNLKSHSTVALQSVLFSFAIFEDNRPDVDAVFKKLIMIIIGSNWAHCVPRWDSLGAKALFNFTTKSMPIQRGFSLFDQGV